MPVTDIPQNPWQRRNSLIKNIQTISQYFLKTVWGILWSKRFSTRWRMWSMKSQTPTESLMKSELNLPENWRRALTKERRWLMPFQRQRHNTRNSSAFWKKSSIFLILHVMTLSVINYIWNWRTTGSTHSIQIHIFRRRNCFPRNLTLSTLSLKRNCLTTHSRTRPLRRGR